METIVESGKTISLEYTVKLDDEAIFDTNVGGNPLTFVHGSQQIIPGLETRLEGMKEGESKSVSVPPEEAYGPVNPEAFGEVSKEEIPPEAMEVGTLLQGRDPNGQTIPLRIAEIRDESVLLDFNHPLAGETLHFEVKVLKIE